MTNGPFFSCPCSKRTGSNLQYGKIPPPGMNSATIVAIPNRLVFALYTENSKNTALV